MKCINCDTEMQTEDTYKKETSINNSVTNMSVFKINFLSCSNCYSKAETRRDMFGEIYELNWKR